MRRLVRVALLAGAALGVAAATSRGRGRELDDRGYKRMNTDLQHPALDAVFSGLTELGSMWASLGAAGTLVAAGRRRTAVRAVSAAGAMWVIGQALKRRHGRARPFDSAAPGRRLIRKPRGTSWPSSHPAVLLAFVTVAGRDLRLSRSERAALGALAASVAASRVYLGVHYPSDVVGGLLLGRAVAELWPDGSPTTR